MSVKTYYQMSTYQHSYLNYVRENPGCIIADVVRGCKCNPQAGHKWVYDGVHRLIRHGVLRCEKRHFKVYLFVNE